MAYFAAPLSTTAGGIVNSRDLTERERHAVPHHVGLLTGSTIGASAIRRSVW
ncbi:hypothetical protein ACFOLD_04785 [Kocuria carniphila]|uniref:hypothetical protein n=1 Tax=Kocuria carniphila TaxID=262208 RepID=UPI0036229C0F